MIGIDDARALLRRALSVSRPRHPEAEVALGGGRHSVCRFSDNEVRSCEEEEWVGLTLRPRIGRHVGAAFTTRLDDAGLSDAWRAAREAALAAQPLGALAPLPLPQGIPSVNAHDSHTAFLGPAARMALVARVCLDATMHGVTASGVLSVREGSIGHSGDPGLFSLLNTRGHFAYHAGTRVRIEITVRAASGAVGYAEADSHSAREIDAGRLLQQAAARARSGGAPRTLAAGRYSVILAPPAVAAFLRALAPAFRASAVDSGTSPIQALGSAVARGNITLTEDPFHPLHRAIPFDAEGWPRRRVNLVQHGVVRGFVYGRLSALKHGVPMTGHTQAAPSRDDLPPSCLVMSGQDRDIEGLISGTERGLFVGRVWYARVVNPRRCTVVGIADGGTIWIEGGAPRYAVHPVRFKMDALEAFSRATALGRPERAGGVVVPPMRVEDFVITGQASA